MPAGKAMSKQKLKKAESLERFASSIKTLASSKEANLMRLIRGIFAPEVCLIFSAFFILQQKIIFHASVAVG